MKDIFKIFKTVKGYKTVIVALITAALGVWSYIDVDLIPTLCNNSGLLCDMKDGEVYGVLLAVVGVLNTLLRFITNSAIFRSRD